MNPGAQSLKKLSAMLLVLSSAGMARGFAAPPARPPEPPPPKSVFIVPTRPQEGRDPFFPDSTRLFQAELASTKRNVPSVTDLVVKSILVNEHGQAFAIINDQTFAAGDEGDVITASGQRMHIQCLEINAAKSTVTIESGDTTATLTYSGN